MENKSGDQILYYYFAPQLIRTRSLHAQTVVPDAHASVLGCHGTPDY